MYNTNSLTTMASSVTSWCDFVHCSIFLFKRGLSGSKFSVQYCRNDSKHRHHISKYLKQNTFEITDKQKKRFWVFQESLTLFFSKILSCEKRRKFYNHSLHWLKSHLGVIYIRVWKRAQRDWTIGCPTETDIKPKFHKISSYHCHDHPKCSKKIDRREISYGRMIFD